MKDIIIVDLDGTLADGRHRLDLLPRAEDAHLTNSWDKFNLAAGNDTPFQDNIQLVNSLAGNGYYIIILSGRSDIARELTVDWLKAHGIYYDELIMRPQSDHRKDIDFKEEALRVIGLERILCAFDDLEHVAKHIRSLGVTCHLVTHYDEKRVDLTPRCDHDWLVNYDSSSDTVFSFCKICKKETVE